MAQVTVQNYPRIEDPARKDNGLLNDAELSQHKKRVSPDELPGLVLVAIENANRKSSRAMLSVPSNATETETTEIYYKIGNDLFKYFQQYSSDPASTAFQLFGQNCREVGVQQFRNKALQKERMNSGWRYQYLAIDCAQKTERTKEHFRVGTDRSGLQCSSRNHANQKALKHICFGQKPQQHNWRARLAQCHPGTGKLCHFR